jgi:hypothetical protein
LVGILFYQNASDAVPKEHIQILERFDGAILYANSGHSWQIPKFNSGKTYEIPEPNSLCYDATHLIDLEDGRCIAYVFNSRSCECLILLGKQTLEHNQLQNPIVIAKSIPELFERIFQVQGRYYFDDFNFVWES